MFRDAAGAPSFAALPGDPDPSPMVESLRDIGTDPARILHPVVRESFLRKGRAAGGAGRGREPFVRVSWDAALDLAAAELDRVRAEHGNEAIYGGSYGWASAGRFHHAQSQVHRFLNTIGGYTRSVQNYSFAAADIILPHVIGDRRGLTGGHTSWTVLAGHAGLIVMFGGAPRRNGQVAAGGVIRHSLRDGLLACRRAGVDFVSVSPMRDDVIAEAGAEWLPVRPNSDVALMLALAHTLVAEGLHDRAFLDRYTVGFDRFRAYLDGSADGVAKSADWAAPLAEVPAGTIRAFARRMARSRTFLMMAWSLQRADHGEQPCWALIALAALLGQIGLPGGGFGLGYGSANGVGNPGCPVAWPSLPQGTNPVGAFIPVARVADMLLKPGEPFDFNGNRHTYPDIRLVYWAGGNPFHHHQDLNRLAGAWQRPETVIVNESFWTPTARHADIVFPVTTFVERNDIACRHGEPFVVASHRIADPPGEARDDYAVFRGLAARLGAEERFT
ncbi:MAG TPA: molybdopterin-dependent oxidoreductase, partial [Bauldia sp.]|nr:molybdopterin-dependent oxidoreductase [Bauldia sp.]